MAGKKAGAGKAPKKMVTKSALKRTKAPALPKPKGVATAKSVKSGHPVSAHGSSTSSGNSEFASTSREGNGEEVAEKGSNEGAPIGDVIQQKPDAKTLFEMNAPVVPQGPTKERPKSSGVRMKNVNSPAKKEPISKSSQRRPRSNLAGKKGLESSLPVATSLEGDNNSDSNHTQVQDQTVPS